MPLQFPSLRRVLFDMNIEINEMYRSYYGWMDSVELSEFEIMVLILEDRRFLVHRGVDVLSVFRELLRAITFRSYGGASTIEMQFIRTINNRKERALRRKIREFILAYIIQYHFEKKAVMRSYLDIAFFGSGLAGAEAASVKVFGRTVTELEKDQCAFLAAMLVYPMPLTPTERWRKKVETRASYALKIRSRFKERIEEVKRGHIIKVC